MIGALGLEDFSNLWLNIMTMLLGEFQNPQCPWMIMHDLLKLVIGRVLGFPTSVALIFLDLLPGTSQTSAWMPRDMLRCCFGSTLKERLLEVQEDRCHGKRLWRNFPFIDV